MWSKLDSIGHLTQSDRLSVSIANNKIYTLDLLTEHVIYSVAATASNSNDFYNG
jgi:hypothetical protein